MGQAAENPSERDVLGLHHPPASRFFSVSLEPYESAPCDQGTWSQQDHHIVPFDSHNKLSLIDGLKLQRLFSHGLEAKFLNIPTKSCRRGTPPLASSSFWGLQLTVGKLEACHRTGVQMPVSEAILTGSA